MQPFAEDFLRGKHLIDGILREDRCAGKAEDVIAFEAFDYQIVHVAKL